MINKFFVLCVSVLMMGSVGCNRTATDPSEGRSVIDTGTLSPTTTSEEAPTDASSAETSYGQNKTEPTPAPKKQ